MPPLHHLNPPPHPFWDFVQGLDDHPFFAGYGPRDPNAASGPSEQPEAAPPQQSPSENARGKQPTVEDPPEVDPDSVTPAPRDGGPHDMPFRGLGRPHGRCGEGAEGRRGPGCHGRGGFRGRGGPFGGHAQPFGFGAPPFWTGPRHHSHHHHQRGPPGEHERRREAPEQTVPGFNLGEFLNNLGDRLGIDLAGAADNLGLDKFTAPKSNEEVDFEPRTDIFDTTPAYVIHLSLPGAKKPDVGVEWDGEHSVLRITGVVHRPDVDEQLLKQLVVNGRKRENGVFEKAIRLGTKRDPASVDVAGISAKMTDGVLVVRVPKVDREIHRREVPISGSASPGRGQDEKDLLFDADEEMYDATPAVHQEDNEVTIDEARSTPVKNKDKAEEARDDRSVTAGREEALPRYAAEEAPTNDNLSDWEKDSEEENEYVKINVD